MDAAQTNTKKIALFLATALLLAAPIHGFAQTLTPSAQTATLGNQICNDAQPISLTSSDGVPRDHVHRRCQLRGLRREQR